MADEPSVEVRGAKRDPRWRAAVVRHREHVEAVRAQSLLELGRDGRASLAWEWALTGTRPAPITLAAALGAPPTLEGIAVEAMAAAQVGASLPGVPGDYQGQIGEARRILAWLAGTSDQIPLDDDNRGRFVGARDDFARTNREMSEILSWARLGLSRRDHKATAAASDRVTYRHSAEALWLSGVRDLLEWVLGLAEASPLCHRAAGLPCSYDLSYEFEAAVDLAAQSRHAEPPCNTSSAAVALPYAEAIQATISWLRGDVTDAPANALGQGPYSASAD